MAFPHTPPPLQQPRPARPRPAQADPSRMPPWGWLELVVLSQTLFSALLFVPGISKARTAIRVAAYLVAPLAWFYVARRNRTPAGSDSFPARPWLIFSAVWLMLEVMHPNSHTLKSAAAQAALYIAILSPALWAPAALASRKQVGRLLAILFVCNALSTVVGIGQVFRPATFNPPDMPALKNIYGGKNLMYETDDGRVIMRPSGLTDTPGSASLAGVTAALVGLCWALRPIGFVKRMLCLGAAFLGIAVIYFTHVRMALVMLAFCLVALIGLFILQRNWRQAALLTTGGVLAFVGAFLWALRSVGSSVAERFGTLVTSDPGTLYRTNRLSFLQHAFNTLAWDSPLGAGMGWWGMTHAYFGNSSIHTDVWVEVMWQAWIQDGGIPLLIGYVGAVAIALYDSTRIALTSPDREIAYWGAVIVALNLSVLVSCFSSVLFLSPSGVQFWLLAAVLHAADYRARQSARAAMMAARASVAVP